MTQSQNQKDRKSIRLKNWNYADEGYYYVTIGTKNRKAFFGEIVDGRMIFNKTGEIANNFWQEIPNHFQFAKLDEFIIMPDHIHGIIEIKHDNLVGTPNLGVQTPGVQNQGGQKPPSPQSPKKWTNNCLGLIINQFKRICTIKINKFDPDFAWQTRFYDHIVRDENDLKRIREYIKNNPLKWDFGKQRRTPRLGVSTFTF